MPDLHRRDEASTLACALTSCVVTRRCPARWTDVPVPPPPVPAQNSPQRRRDPFPAGTTPRVVSLPSASAPLPGRFAWAPRLCVSPGCFACVFYPGVLPWCSAVSPSLDQAPLAFCLALLGEGAPPSHRRGRKITYCPVCSNCTIGIQIYKRVLALPSANTFPSHRTTALQHRYTSRICVLYCIFS